MDKIVQTAGRDGLGSFAPDFAHFNDDILFGENWNNQDISLKTRCIITVSSTTFGPNDPCTAAHILTFLWRAAVSWPEELAAVTNWAGSKGIAVPSNLDTVCTRASSVLYMWRAAGSPEPRTDSGFTDVPASADYAKAVSWAVENGLTAGTSSTTFSPGDGCTRGQIVTFLYREKVEPLRVYTTDPGIRLSMTECNYLRVRESGTSYDFSSANVSVLTIWNNAHGKDRTVTWSVDDPDVLELTMMKWGGDDLWPIFTGKKPGSAKVICRVVAGDGHAAEAYCYVTVLGPGEPAPTPAAPPFTPPPMARPRMSTSPRWCGW